MHISDCSQLDWEVAVPHRPGDVRYKRLLTRDRELESLEVSVARVLAKRATPRHHHNFDQFRIGLAGVLDFGRGQKLMERTIMYTPAGTWYGPETWFGPESETPTLAAIFQFDGECQGGYIPYDKVNAATKELMKHGQFKGGFYYPNEPGERKAIDGNEASYEYVTGKKVVYPEPLVDEPLYLHIDAVPWVTSPERGIEVKTIGAFGNHGMRLAMSKLQDGATRVLSDSANSTIAFCLTGSATVDARPFGLHSALLLEPGESVSATGTTGETELVEITLPNFNRDLTSA